MNIAPINHAAAGAQPSGYARIRRLIVSVVLGTAVIAAAQAGPAERERGQHRRAPEAASERQGADRRADSPDIAARSQERRELQQIEQNRDAEAFRRNGRMTPDERRDLRRQINEAGNDIYPNRRRR